MADETIHSERTKVREQPSPPSQGRGTGGRSKLFLDTPFAELWAGQDPFAAVERLQGEVFRELEGRRTVRTEVAGRGYFVKIHRGIGWGRIFENLLLWRWPVLGAKHEWQAIAHLTALGVDTMKAVAFGARGVNPARQHSFIITEELAPTVSLEDYCRNWPTQPPSPALKRALIARVAAMTGKMHRGGMNHRDCYLCHFLLHTDPAPAPASFRAGEKSEIHLRLSVIDLHRAQIRATPAPRRWRDKDLASLYFSALEIGLTRRDFLRFLRGYFERPLRQILAEETALFAYLEREGQRLMERYRRKFAPKETA